MKYAVHCPTQQDYDTLMQAYEAKGWRWADKARPTSYNNWPTEKTETAIDFHDKFQFSSRIRTEKFYGYTVITLKEALTKLNMSRTIEQVQKGDLLKLGDDFRRVLDVRGEGELALVDLSRTHSDFTNDNLKRWLVSYTIFQLKDYGYTIYEPEETTEVMGKKYKTSELTDRLKELKEVE